MPLRRAIYASFPSVGAGAPVRRAARGAALARGAHSAAGAATGAAGGRPAGEPITRSTSRMSMRVGQCMMQRPQPEQSRLSYLSG